MCRRWRGTTPTLHARDGEAAVVWRPGACRGQELQALEVRVDRRRRQPSDVLARSGVGDVEVDRQAAPLGQKRDVFTIRAQRRADVDRTATGALCQQSSRTFPVGCFGLFTVARRDVIGRVDGGVPLGREVLVVEAGRQFDGTDRIHPALHGTDAVEGRGDGFVPERAADVGPEGVTEPVGEIRGVVEVGEVR